MQYICIIFCIVLGLNLHSTSKVYKTNTLPEKPWIWSVNTRVNLTPTHDNYQNTENTTKTISDEEPQTRNDCNSDKPPMPNFRKSGRRVSETKCLEYVWDRKIREEVRLNFTACIRELRKKNKYIGPHFAIGGVNALPGEFPHMGGIGWRARQGAWIFKCGCSLISDKFTLTAAHCSKSPLDTSVENAVPEIVRLGDKNLIDVYSNGMLPQDYRILSIIIHPKYSPPKKYYDIALMKIETIVSFTNNLQPACLWSHFDTSQLGTSATLTGWGVVETATKTTSPILQAAVVDIVDSEQCDKLLRPACYRHWCGIEEHQLCAGKLAGGVDACQGDSGGPLQVKIPLPFTVEGSMHYVVGVTSFGIGCARPNLPGVYTRVSSFIDWIESIVWPDN